MALKPSTLLLSGIGIVAAVALLVVTFRAEPVPVDLYTLARGAMQITVNADGKTRIRDKYEVSAPLVGTARRSPVEVGDSVVMGETVVAVVQPVAPDLLDSRSRLQAEAAIGEAEAALRLANSRYRQASDEMTYAQTQLERTKALAARGVTALTQLEDVTQRKEIAVAARDAAASALTMAASSLTRVKAALIDPDDPTFADPSQCCIEIRAPISGSVLSVEMVSEHAVAAGSLLLSIGQTDDLEIVADLLSSDAVRLAPGAEAIVERWGGPIPLEARLRTVEPSARTKVSALGIEEQRVDATLDLLSPPAERPGLGDGFSVFLRIIEWSGQNLLQVPLSAVFRSGENWSVFVNESGVARRVEIKIGHRNNTFAEVVDGLAAGQTVITHPSDAIGDGVRIIDRSGM